MSGWLVLRPTISIPSLPQPTKRYKPTNAPVSHLVYSGPFSTAVKSIKIVSVMTSTTALFVSPLLLLFGREEVPMVGKAMVVAITLIASWGTTGMLHMLTRTYIHKLFYDRAEQKFTAHTSTLFSRTRETQFLASEIAQPKTGFSALFSTFVAKKRHFYLHQELMRESNIDLYMRVLGMKKDKIEKEKEREHNSSKTKSP